MTPQQRNREAVLSSLSATREAASAAGKPELSPALRALSLFDALKAAKRDGRIEDARAYAQALRPLVGYLPEEV